MATVTDLAKIAYLLLKGGKWGERQLIPEDFARDAISPLKSNEDTVAVQRFNCGYGYQIWSHPGGAFAFRGLGGQIAVGYPERDLVIACNSDTSANHNAYDDIFDAIESVILPEYPPLSEAKNTASRWRYREAVLCIWSF
jgi:CubicO group peptidase (beta-lactamase class C family)